MQEEESCCVQKSDSPLISWAWHSFYHLQRPKFISVYISWKHAKELPCFSGHRSLQEMYHHMNYFLLTSPGLQSLRLWCRALSLQTYSHSILFMLFNVYYITRKKLWMEATGPGSKISSTEQLLVLVLLLLHESKQKFPRKYNWSLIINILNLHKDQGIKKAFFFFNFERKSQGDDDTTTNPEIVSTEWVPSSWNFVSSSFSIGLCPVGIVLLKII